MNLGRLVSVVAKEVRQLRHDRRMIGLLLIVPVIQLLIYAYGISTDLRGVRLGIILEEPSPAARALVRGIETQPAFRITRVSARPGDLRPWLDDGTIQVGLHLPHGFSAALDRGEAPVIQVLSDGSDPNTATVAYQYLLGAVSAWAEGAHQERLRRHPELAVRQVGVARVGVRSRFWYNAGLRSLYSQIPGVLVLILLTITMTLTSLMVAKERELGTLEQISVTPIQAVELLVGKTVPVAVIGLLMTAVVVITARLWFQMPLRGSVAALFLIAALFLLNTTGMGLLLSVVSRNQLQAQLAANFVTTPLIMLGGLLFPISNMPEWAQWLTYLFPTRYCTQAMQAIFLKGVGIPALWPQIAGLVTLGCAFYAGGLLLFHKRAG